MTTAYLSFRFGMIHGIAHSLFFLSSSFSSYSNLSHISQELIRSEAKLFASELLSTSEKLLSQYDGVVDTSEILPPCESRVGEIRSILEDFYVLYNYYSFVFLLVLE